LRENRAHCFRTSSSPQEASAFPADAEPACDLAYVRALVSFHLLLREIISARRLPSRAMFKTRSRRVFALRANLRINSSSRMMLTSHLPALEVQQVLKFFFVLLLGFFLLVNITFCPASFSTSAMYSFPFCRLHHAPASRRRRNWSISAGVPLLVP